MCSEKGRSHKSVSENTHMNPDTLDITFTRHSSSELHSSVYRRSLKVTRSRYIMTIAGTNFIELIQY